MLNFLKKSNRAKAKRGSISSANMSAREYMSAVEGEILPHWIDECLMSKIGIDDLFADDIAIKKSLSYDEAYDCLRRAMRMIDIAAYVSHEFSERSRAIGANSTVAFKQHLSDVASGNAHGTFEVKDQFYSANTIRDLFIEAQSKVTVHGVEKPNDLDDAMKRLTAAVGSLSHIKYATFLHILMSAKAALANMVGFV
jgi:hypothetical protein